VPNFLVFSPLVLFWLLIFLNFDLIVESAGKMDIRQFMKRKSISESRGVESISDKRLKIEVQTAQPNGIVRLKRFVNVY